MMKKIKLNVIYLGFLFLLLILMHFMDESYSFFKGFFKYPDNAIYGCLWIALVDFLIYFFVKKVGVKKPLISLFGLSLFGLIISLFFVVLNKFIPTDKLIQKNYIGIGGLTTDYDKQTDTEYFVEKNIFVFNKKDPQIKKEVFKLKNEYGKTFEYEFVYWQSAFLKGFKPRNISEFTGTNSRNKKLKLFFSSGPIFILEIFIYAINNSIILMFIAIICLSFNIKFIEDYDNPFMKNNRWE